MLLGRDFPSYATDVQQVRCRLGDESVRLCVAIAITHSMDIDEMGTGAETEK